MDNVVFRSISVDDIMRAVLNLKQLVFEVTDGCNLKCKYCGYGELYDSYDTRISKALPYIKAKLLIDYLIEFWDKNDFELNRKTISIGFYGGEPLLNVSLIKKIQHYIETTASSYILPQYCITTNAMLLNLHMDYLAENNFQLLISLDGNQDAQSYRVDHDGKNSFNRVYANVKLLMKKYPDYFNNKVSFNAVLHDKNNTAHVYEYLKQEFGKTPMISQLNTNGIREDKKEIFKSMFIGKQEDFYKSSNYKQMISEMFYDVADTKMLYLYLEQFSGNIFKSYSDLFVNKTNLSYRQSGTCIPFEKKMYLTVNGKILACERINQKYGLGTVTSKEVELDFVSITNRYNAYLDKIKNQCFACFRKYFCIQCIYNIEDLEEEAVCKGFMNKQEFELFENAQISYLSNNPHLYKRIINELTIY